MQENVLYFGEITVHFLMFNPILCLIELVCLWTSEHSDKKRIFVNLDLRIENIEKKNSFYSKKEALLIILMPQLKDRMPNDSSKQKVITIIINSVPQFFISLHIFREQSCIY